MGNPELLCIPAPDTEEATFDRVNYHAQQRREATDALRAEKIAQKEAKEKAQKERAAQRRTKARILLSALLLVCVALTVYFLAFADGALLINPLAGCVVCVIAAIVLFAAGYLSAQATL